MALKSSLSGFDRYIREIDFIWKWVRLYLHDALTYCLIFACRVRLPIVHCPTANLFLVFHDGFLPTLTLLLGTLAGSFLTRSPTSARTMRAPCVNGGDVSWSASRMLSCLR